MTTPTLDDARSRSALRGITLLVASYLGLSALTLVAVIALRDDPALVTDAVWVRCVILVLVSLLTVVITRRAARGSRRDYLRLRIVTAVQVVAIALIIALPGPFPLWLKIEQGVCGLILIGLVVQANGKHLRSAVRRPA